jgi:GNAT superfamily N-acetyltransferase
VISQGAVHVEDVSALRSRWPQLVAVLEDYRSHLGNQRDAERATDWLTAQLEARRLLGYLATIADGTQHEVAGMALILTSPAATSLRLFWSNRDLFVAQAHRRQGVATALLAKVRADAAASGVRRIYLMTEKDNRPALALYGSCGFQTFHGQQELVLVL